VTGGTRVLSDRIVVTITAQPGESFIDRMIALVEGADRQKTPNEIALNMLLAGLTIAFVLAVTALQPFAARFCRLRLQPRTGDAWRHRWFRRAGPGPLRPPRRRRFRQHCRPDHPDQRRPAMSRQRLSRYQTRSIVLR
jgi:hypothetical protein